MARTGRLSGPVTQEEPAIPSILAVPVLIWMVAFGLATAWSAAQLGRARVLWFVFGAILGPIALALLRAAPPALCRSCGSLTRGWLTVCWWCRQSVFGSASEAVLAVGFASTGSVNQASPRSEIARRTGPQWLLRERLGAPLPSDGIARPTAPRPEPPAKPVVPSLEVTTRGMAPSPAAPRPEAPRVLEASRAAAAPGPAPESIRTRRSPSSAAPAGAAPTGTAPTGAALPTPQPPPRDARRDGSSGHSREATRPASTSSVRGAAPVEPRPAGDSTGTLATAVYVAGSTNLQSGHRYGIAVRGSKLHILGPTEVEPERVALDRPLEGLDARFVDGRLIVADAHGFVLAFMAVAGPSTRDLAATITEAARGVSGR